MWPNSQESEDLLPFTEKLLNGKLQSCAVYAVLLTDLSKNFNCLANDLVMAKLHVYGCNLSSVILLNSYLHNRCQQVKINNFYSSWAELLFVVLQESIPGPILFNIFICNLFLFIKNMIYIT